MKGVGGTAAIGMLGALGAAAAGVPEASVAIAAGAAQVAHRSALAYSRSEEASADQAGLRYLAAAGGDAQAMLDVLDHFRGQDALLSAGHVDSYALSHPMCSERMALIEDRVAKLPPGAAPKAEDAYWHRRMVAKLDAFLGSPAQTLRKYPERDASEAAALARAIAWHRRPDPARADAAMQALLAARPDDPFYLDLEGQFLLESGRAAAAAEVYRQAVALAPKEPLILGGLGRALLNMDEDAATAEATHGITAYATGLATVFHGYYRDRRVLDPADPATSAARLALVDTTRLALRNTLRLLGISTPEQM